MPKFSIITVCKNAINGIANTIDSVLAQNFTDYEYIIIDSQSNDGTIDVIKRYNLQITHFISEPDKGIYDAMNKGISISTGEYVLFLNAGDKFTTDYSVAAVNSIIEQRNSEIYFGKIIWVDVKNKFVITSKHEHIKYKSQLYFENFPHPATIYTRKVFDRYGLFDLNFPVYGDYEWNLRALVKHNASFFYADFIVTTFFTDGISNNFENILEKQSENEILKSLYFNAIPNKPSTKKNILLDKIINKVVQFKLNRIF
jgi:glycosyltransferase involved in cell wall biosynthesis